MNPTAANTDSGSKVDIIQNSTQQKSFHMDNIKSTIHLKKTVLRSSAKLKSHIHSQINDLIETLKERERELFLQIEEHELDCMISIADINFSDPSVTAKATDIDAKECSCRSFGKRLLKFAGNYELLKPQLLQFGKLEEGEETTNECNVCVNETIPDSPKVKNSCFSIIGMMRKGTQRLHKESYGSIESFEVIDSPDHEEYQTYIQSLEDANDVETASEADEFQPWKPSFPIHMLPGTMSEPEAIEPEPEAIEPEAIKPKPRILVPQHSGFGGCKKIPTKLADKIGRLLTDRKLPCQLADKKLPCQLADKKLADPVMQINKQMQSMWCSSSKPQNSKSQLNETLDSTLNSTFPVEQQGAKSDELSSQVTLKPSAIIQKKFNQFLNQEDTGKWLVSSEDRLGSKISSGRNLPISNPKGLHFKMG